MTATEDSLSHYQYLVHLVPTLYRGLDHSVDQCAKTSEELGETTGGEQLIE